MDIYEVLNKLNIKFDEVEHKEVHTILEANFIKTLICGVACKNLFLTNKKDKYVLVLLEESKIANIKGISKNLNIGHLSFSNENELKEILNLKPGSITPLGIINDINNKVLLLIDKDLVNHKLLMHPNINTKTISIKYEDLIKFIEYGNHKYMLI